MQYFKLQQKSSPNSRDKAEVDEFKLILTPPIHQRGYSKLANADLSTHMKINDNASYRRKNRTLKKKKSLSSSCLSNKENKFLSPLSDKDLLR